MNVAQYKIKNAIDNCNLNEFIFKDIDFCGEDAVLVNPKHMGVNWTQTNKYLRSVIYRKSDYYPLSLGFHKFTNYNENITHFPVPTSLNNSIIIDKIDGSCVICSYHNNTFNIRTRGTKEYTSLQNKQDFEYVFNKKYPQIQKYLKDNSDVCLLFEIVSPNQKIVLNYEQIDLFLIGANCKLTYELKSQFELDGISSYLSIKRPKYYQFDDLSSLLNTIRTMKNIEGCIIYSDKGLHKVKSEQYLKLHTFKSNATFKNILELYIDNNYPSFEVFKKFIIDHFDWECWQMVDSIVSDIINIKINIDSNIENIKDFVYHHVKTDQKTFAFIAIKEYNKKYIKVVFLLRNKKQINDKIIKSLIKEHYEELNEY